MAHPFLPMTNEMLKKLSQVTQDSNLTIISPDLPTEFASREFKSGLELIPQCSETNHPQLPH
jgi:hypothetical protein